MKNKYRARAIVAEGERFDSKKEYSRWCALRLLERAGKITDLRRQVRYTLIPPQREPDIIGPRGGVKPGRLLERPVEYVADFVYQQEGKTIVEDTKGVKTPEYIIKRKLMLWVHGIRILET